MHAMNKLQLNALLSMLTVAVLAGCSANLADIAATVQDIKAKQGDKTQHLTSLIADESTALGEVDELSALNLAGKDANSTNEPLSYSPPYPQRKNPF